MSVMMQTSVACTLYVGAPSEAVWAALFNPALTRQFWGQHQNASTWVEGDQWEHREAGSGRVDAAGEVVVVDAEEPERRLVLTWMTSEVPLARPTTVTFVVEPFMDATKLSVLHERLDPGCTLERAMRDGWPLVLSSLKTLLETGRPLPATTRPWGPLPPRAPGDANAARTPGVSAVCYIASTPDDAWNALFDAQAVLPVGGAPADAGDIDEMDPPARLVLTQPAPAGMPAPRLTFLVEPVAGMVRLTVIHEGLQPGSPAEQEANDEWPRVLSNLKSLLESRAPASAATAPG